MIDIIQTLKVRGAPLIGVAAALALAQYVEQKGENVEHVAGLLKEARPTAVNLAHCVDRLLTAYGARKDKAALIYEAEAIFLEDAQLCERMAQHSEAYIEQGDRILTICNTGGLVTTGIGTALGAIIHAQQQGKSPFVYACETRPLLQGGRLTAWECLKNNIPHEILCDSMAADLMRQGKVDAVFVGADRIAPNGDFANKVGTYGLAVLAKEHNIPFYVVAPYTTVDPQCANGDQIPIEMRDQQEVRGVRDVTWSPPESPAYNPSFSMTPAKYVTAYILDSGVYYPEQLKQAFEQPDAASAMTQSL